MERVKTTTVSSARDFFAEEVRSAMKRNRLDAHPGAIEYLTNLMVRYMESDVFFAKNAEGKLENNVLAALYFEYVNGSVEQKIVTLRRLGDICLLISGFFADSLKRKLVDVDYYLGMGGSAYSQLASFQTKDGKTLFEELAQKFRPFSDVLGEISERSGLQSNTDLLRMYERWLFTGSDRLKRLLTENGIATNQKIDSSTKH